MDIYNYHGVTGEFLSKSEARPDPLEKNKFLIPANATKKVPPVSAVNKTPVFDGTKWSLVPDHRKDAQEYYSKSDGSLVEFSLGDSPNASMQKTIPAAVQTAMDELIRISDIQSETVNRTRAIIAGADSFDHIGFIEEMWKSLNAGSRTPTYNFQSVLDIYAIAKTAITDSTALNDIIWP